MSEENYFVRWRGIISGAFTMAQLKSMIQQGQLSKFHQISADKQKWTPAGQIQELYPSYILQKGDASEQPVPPQPLPPRTQTQVETPPEQNIEPVLEVQIPEGNIWYYTHNEETFGPTSIEALKELIKGGLLDRNDILWQEGNESIRTAESIPALTPGFALVAQFAGGKQQSESGYSAIAIVFFFLSLMGLLLFPAALVIRSYVLFIPECAPLLCGIFLWPAMIGIIRSESKKNRRLAKAGLIMGGAGIIAWLIFAIFLLKGY